MPISFVPRRAIPLVIALALIAGPAAARAQEHEHDPAERHLAHGPGGFPAYVDIFFTHHAYLEKKLHPRFDTTLSEDSRTYAGSAELVWQFGSRLGAELAAGFVATDPDEREGESGFGDVEVAPMLALLQDPDRLLIVTARSGFVLPTGDADRGLGIDGWGWEPGLLVWKGFGAHNRGALQAELGYERVFADEGEDEEELVYNLGLSWWLPSNWVPILEVNGVMPLGSESEEEEEHAVVAATLGFRYAFANGQQWGAGVQVPLSGDSYDAKIVVGGIIHFE